MHTHNPDRASLTRYAWLSISAAIITILLKAGAYMLTGSVGLFSDALESTVNLIGALMALTMLTIAARPADENHAYGHTKAEYFSSGIEGTLIVVAAVSIAITAFQRFINPQPLEQVGMGLGVSIVASLVNLGVALVLLRAAKEHNSITLEANAQHLLTDVWTSVGVLVGVGIVALTGWQRLDPIVAFVVAGNIVLSGGNIVRKSVSGLMDTALPTDERDKVQKVLEPYLKKGVRYHAFRTRQSGARQFVSLHVLMPGDWTIQDGHDVLEQIETSICDVLPGAAVFTHMEPLDDPASWNDITFDR
jgi:cation diffusion facilitator family transporter